MRDKFFSDTTFILALLTSASYVLGVTYCQGFLREFGIDDTQFPLSFDRYLFQGFISFADVGAPAMMMLAAAMLCIAFAILIYLFVKELLKRKSARKAKRDEKIKYKPVEEEPWVTFWSNIIFAVGCYFGGFFGILIAAVFSTDAGSKAAINFKDKMERGEVRETYVSMKAPEDSFSGFSVICNQSQCAYFLDKRSKIVSLSDVKYQEIIIN